MFSPAKIVVLLFVVSACVQPAPAQTAPHIKSIDPGIVTAFKEVSIVITGDNFTEGITVHISINAPASGGASRYIKYDCEFVSDSKIRVDLPFGLELRPRERLIYVKNPDGTKSNTIRLRVLSPAEEPPPVNEPPGEDTDPESVEGSDAETEISSPLITRIEPATIDAGRRFSMLIYGDGFSRGATLKILANKNIGTFKQPDYQFVEIPLEILDETVAEALFDKGFYHVPTARELYIENPDGGQSNKMVLNILEAIYEEK